MMELTVVEFVCLLVAGALLGVAGICVLFGWIAASQKGAVGCFALAGVVCCGLVGLLMLAVLS